MTSNKDLANALYTQGIQSQNIIDAFGQVDRANFVLSEYSSQAYENHPISIGFEQTISQPYRCIHA